MKKFIILTLLLLSAPFLVSASLDTNLYYGMKNNSDVMQLQRFLINKGLLSGNITGDFTVPTLVAVKAYQASMGITINGSVGPVTRKAINDELATNPQGIAMSQNQKDAAADMIKSQIKILQQQLAELQTQEAEKKQTQQQAQQLQEQQKAIQEQITALQKSVVQEPEKINETPANEPPANEPPAENNLQEDDKAQDSNLNKESQIDYKNLTFIKSVSNFFKYFLNGFVNLFKFSF
jgi:hypothetical protein